MQHPVQILNYIYIYIYTDNIHQCQSLWKEVQLRHLQSSWLNVQSGCADVFHWLFWETTRSGKGSGISFNRLLQKVLWKADLPEHQKSPSNLDPADESLQWMQNNLKQSGPQRYL